MTQKEAETTFLRVAGIVDDSIVDGPGVRYTIFTQGCAHNCPGCHNPQTHDYAGGQNISIDDIMQDLRPHKYIKAVTFSGGEPLDQPEALEKLISIMKSEGYHVLIFSGYTLEEILTKPAKLAALRLADTLIDGRYEQDKRTLALDFRGSSNQRIIDIHKLRKLRLTFTGGI